MDVGGILYGIVAGGILLFVLRVGRKIDRDRQRNVNRARWVDSRLTADDRRRGMRRVRHEAMWDAVAERDRRASERRKVR